MLSLIKSILGDEVTENWLTEMSEAARQVKLFNDYVRGKHQARMTDEMRKMLRVPSSTNQHFNANYCDLVIQMMNDRLRVNSIEGDSPTSTGWGSELLTDNRFDALQIRVHEAMLTTGSTFVMVWYDNVAQMVRLTHEPVYDGHSGVIAVYDRNGQQMICAIKIWFEGALKRCNFYYPDRVVRYSAGTDNSDALTFMDEQANLVGHIPLICFRNRVVGRDKNGQSELSSIIGLQDALNRVITSTLITTELASFPMFFAVGFNAPSSVYPGMIINIKDAVSNDQRISFDMTKQGELVPFIEVANFLINQIAITSRTPLPGIAGDSVSGESLKQRDVHLLSKVKKFQIETGNVWEDLINLAAKTEATYGLRGELANYKRWYARWANPETRNDANVIDNALKLADKLTGREFLRIIAPVFEWDEAKIDRILEERLGEETGRLRAMMQGAAVRFDLPSEEMANG
jgi:hypothetical protein